MTSRLECPANVRDPKQRLRARTVERLRDGVFRRWYDLALEVDPSPLDHDWVTLRIDDATATVRFGDGFVLVRRDGAPPDAFPVPKRTRRRACVETILDRVLGDGYVAHRVAGERHAKHVDHLEWCRRERKRREEAATKDAEATAQAAFDAVATEAGVDGFVKFVAQPDGTAEMSLAFRGVSVEIARQVAAAIAPLVRRTRGI